MTNEETEVSESRFLRQLDIFHPDKMKEPVHIVGAGAIGSFLAMALAKMGFTNIIIYDPDTITEHNLPNQFFKQDDVEKPKVLALVNLIEDFTGVQAIPEARKFTPQDRFKGIVISAMDNMEGRIALWSMVKRQRSNIGFFIDGRMAAEVMRIYTINPRDDRQCEIYEKSLYSSAKAVAQRCTASAIMYTVLLVAGFMAQQIKKALMGEKYSPELVYAVKTDSLITLKE